MTCPQCQSAMDDAPPRRRHGAPVLRRASGIFLERADLGNLIEAENDWHRDSGPMTQPLPRITAGHDRAAAGPPVARAYIETLFG